VQARGLQSLGAESAGAVRVGKRHHDHVAAFDGAHAGTDGFDDANRLVAHAAAFLDGLQFIVWPEIAAANAGASNADQRIARMDDGGVRDILDADVPGTVHDGCAHRLSPVCDGLRLQAGEKTSLETRSF